MKYYILHFLAFCCTNIVAQEISLDRAIKEGNIEQVTSYLKQNASLNVTEALLYADNIRALKAIALNRHIESPYTQLPQLNKIAHITMLAAFIYIACSFNLHMIEALYKDHKARGQKFHFQYSLHTLQEIPTLCFLLSGLLITMFYNEYMKEKSKNKINIEYSLADTIYNLIANHQKQFDQPTN